METDVLEVLRQQAKVTRSNALARSKHQLGLLQNRLMYLLFSRIQRNEDQLLTQRIPIADIRERLNISYGSFYPELREAVTDLVRQPLSLEREHGGWKVLSWVTSAEYVPGGKPNNPHGYLEIKLHEDLAPHLLHLREKYNSIPLDALLALSSTHSQRLVDILWHDSFAGQRAQLNYEIEDLKARMNLEGKYARFRDFCRILDAAKDEFEQKIPFRFAYRGIKVGRSWQSIHFEIWAVTPSEQDFDASPLTDRESAVASRLQQAGYTQDVQAALATYPISEIERVLESAYTAQRRAAQSQKPIRNLGGLIHSLLQSGAGKALTPTPQALVQNVREHAEALYDAWLEARAVYANQLWSELPESDRPFVLDYMRLHLKPFLLKQLEQQQMKGVLFEKACADCMVELELLHYPAPLDDLHAYAKTTDTWVHTPVDIQPSLLDELRTLAQ